MTKPLTWPQRFDSAEKRGKFTSNDFDRAAGWTYCAVGEHNAMLPKQHQYDEETWYAEAPFFYDSPDDGGLGLVSQEDADHLVSLGVRFFEAVEADDVFLARALCAEIDQWYDDHPVLMEVK